ncbi:MAG: hypothetical protein IE917_17395, partial [Betaproteobacteria bacterium]|nr:hypothetical protein [Betaproteobacteria bacterium]
AALAFFDRDVTVAFIGGSITVGARIPRLGKWSYLVGQHLDQRFRSATVLDYSYPGTGTYFAAHRLDEEMGDAKPDIAFIEFAVNDEGRSESEVDAYTDAVVAQLRKRNPDVLIAYVAVTRADQKRWKNSGALSKTADYARSYSEMAGVQFIDAGTGLWNAVNNGDYTIGELLPDGVHPSPVGHAIYAAEVDRQLDTWLDALPRSSAATAPLIDNTNLASATMWDGNFATGCAVAPQVGVDRYLSNALTCNRGQVFAINFTGTALGMVQAVTTDSGQLSCVLDGKAQKPIDFYYAIANDPPPKLVRELFSDLPDGRHELVCVAQSSKNNPDRGRIVIGRFLTNSGTIPRR